MNQVDCGQACPLGVGYMEGSVISDDCKLKTVGFNTSTVGFPINIACDKMGGCQFTVPEGVRRQWTESTRHGRIFIKSEVTSEEFELIQDVQAQEQELDLLLGRSIYPIPGTPKLILLQDQTQARMSVLVQVSESNLSQKLCRINFWFDLLQVYRQLVGTLHCLYKQFGAFHVHENLISLSDDHQSILWINENRMSSEVQHKMEDCLGSPNRMVSQLIEMVKKYAPMPLGVPQIQSTQNFKEYIRRLDLFILQEKIKKEQMIEVSSAGTGSPRVISPMPSSPDSPLRFPSPKPAANLVNASPVKTRSGQAPNAMKKSDTPSFLLQRKQSQNASNRMLFLKGEEQGNSFVSNKSSNDGSFNLKLKKVNSQSDMQSKLAINRSQEVRAFKPQQDASRGRQLMQQKMNNPNFRMSRQPEPPKELNNLMATATSTILGNGEDIPKRVNTQPHNGPLTKMCSNLASSQFVTEEDVDCDLPTTPNFTAGKSSQHEESAFSRFMKP